MDELDKWKCRFQFSFSKQISKNKSKGSLESFRLVCCYSNHVFKWWLLNSYGDSRYFIGSEQKDLGFTSINNSAQLTFWCACESSLVINSRPHVVRFIRCSVFISKLYINKIILAHTLSFYMGTSHHFTELFKNENKGIVLNQFVYLYSDIT